MELPPYKFHSTGNAVLDRIQNNVRDLISALRMIPFLLQGRLVSCTFKTGVQKNVRHGLGVPAACIVIRQNYDPGIAAVRIGEFGPDIQSTIDQREFLALGTDADAILDLWFYPRSSQKVPQ